MRSHDFCKWMFPRARLRTTQNTPDHWKVIGAAVTGELKITFQPGQPPELHRDRGREHRTSALPSGIALAGDFAPTPIAPGTSCRVNRSLPCPERRGKRGEPPASPRLHGEADDRVVRRATSAKRGDAHQPEGPSFLRLPASGQVHRSTCSRSWTATAQRLFHHQET